MVAGYDGRFVRKAKRRLYDMSGAEVIFGGIIFLAMGLLLSVIGVLYRVTAGKKIRERLKSDYEI